MRLRFCRARMGGLLLAALLLTGCYTQVPEHRARPKETRPAAHYRAFADADALAAYLRYDSVAGPLMSAHRGGPAPGYPENALPTFERALHYAPALIECDVRLSRDSVLVLMHDEMLERTTTGTGRVDAHSLAALRRRRLVDPLGRATPFRIPTLAEALAWAEGRAVLTLDVKKGVPATHVLRAVRQAGAADRVVVITYTLEETEHYHRLAPELILSATAETLAAAQALLESGIDPSRLIVFTGVGEVQPEVIALLHTHGIRAMLGTFGEIDARAHRNGPAVYRALLDQGLDVLATDLVPVAAQAVQTYEPAYAP